MEQFYVIKLKGNEYHNRYFDRFYPTFDENGKKHMNLITTVSGLYYAKEYTTKKQAEKDVKRICNIDKEANPEIRKAGVTLLD